MIHRGFTIDLITDVNILGNCIRVIAVPFYETRALSCCLWLQSVLAEVSAVSLRQGKVNNERRTALPSVRVIYLKTLLVTASLQRRLESAWPCDKFLL